MYDIIIVGAGTAGLSAAIYGLRAGKSVLVLEQASYGGQIINTPSVENYPGIEKISGYEFASGLYKQAEKLGMEYRCEQVKGVRLAEEEEKKITATDFSEKMTAARKKTVETAASSYEAASVILATGAKNRPLGLEKEEAYIGKGISYCATCDGMFFRGKRVAVAGGGNTALEDAAFLSNYCERVYLIHRREQFRGEEKLAADLREKENVEFLLNKTVTALEGEPVLQAITVKDKINGTEERLEVSGLFIAIGQMPENAAFAGLVELDEGGYIRAGEDCRTSVPGIFAAGDCRTKTVRQLTTAAADGAVAGLAASQI